MRSERNDDAVRVFIVAALATLFISGGPSSSADLETGSNLANGEAHYDLTCIACHGENGKGSVPGAPDFTNGWEPLTKDDETLLRSMHEGMQSPGSPLGMPPMGAMEDMSMDDLADVLAYIRKEFETK